MAITAYTGPPGSGKSYALVAEVIVNGVIAGRRILTNIDGLKPEKVYAYCRKKAPEAALGEIILFHGNDAHDPLFWPHEGLSDEQTVVKGGDLIIFDEWKLYFNEAGELQSKTVVPFIRWHRHLTDKEGRSCDLVIATQIIGDLHRSFRGTVESSLKFTKLSMVGFSKGYRYDVFTGHKQNKSDYVRTGNGTYKKSVFPLYKTSQAEEGTHAELKTDSRASMFTKAWPILGFLAVLAVGFGGWKAYSFFNPEPLKVAQEQSGQAITSGQAPLPRQQITEWRIAGHVVGYDGLLVLIQSRDGRTRYVGPESFVFDGERPVRGTVDGKTVLAEQWVFSAEEGEATQ